MRTLSRQLSQTDTAKEKFFRAQSPLGQGRSHFISPLSTGQPLLQRQCACGGGCPRCQEEALEQTKLKISEPGDQYEQEADRVADQVMRMPEPTTQQQMEPEEDEEALQAKRMPGQMPEATPSLESHIQQRQGLGQSMAKTTRTKMESSFGGDFSGVNIHTDNHAVQMNQALNAQAFTVGNDVFFNSGKYAPGSAAGDHLLAHELTHVVQQTEGLQPFIQRKDDEEQGCDGTVGDIFELFATMATSPPEFSAALIGRRNRPNELPTTYYLGDSLNAYMIIVDIPDSPPFEGVVLVMHCETLETLKYGQPPEPKHITKVKCGNFGPGTVKTFNNCQKVEFVPEDSSKPEKVYILENEIYWLQDNTRTGYSPSDLEGYLGVHLQGNMCGMLKECQGSEEKGNKIQKGYEGIVPPTLEEFTQPEEAYGSIVQQDKTKSGGSVVQYKDGTIEYYNPENKLQMTYRLYNGQYSLYGNKEKIGIEIDKSVLEGELGVRIL